MIRRVLGWPDVIVVTSYEGMKSLKALLLPCNWDYCVLDEGQRIRNPDAEVPRVSCMPSGLRFPFPSHCVWCPVESGKRLETLYLIDEQAVTVEYLKLYSLTPYRRVRHFR